MDYEKYRISKTVRLLYGFVGSACGVAVGYLFYRHWITMVLFSGLGFLVAVRAGEIHERRKVQWNLLLEFKDAMDSMVSALVAGYSMENAITEAYEDLQMLHGRNTYMVQELWEIQKQLELHESLDQLLLDFGRRSNLEDIIMFGQIYATARKSGGNMVRVMKRTAENIGQKIQVKKEIQTMIAGKKMESMCMMAVPLLIIVYLSVCSKGFLDPLYMGISGRLFMTIVLILYFVSILWCRKIMNIMS